MQCDTVEEHKQADKQQGTQEYRSAKYTADYTLEALKRLTSPEKQKEQKVLTSFLTTKVFLFLGCSKRPNVNNK